MIDPRKSRMNSPNYWYEGDDKLLKGCWHDEQNTLAEIAVWIGRTPSAIYQQARLMGLDTKSRTLTPKCLAEYKAKLTIRIARDRSIGSIGSNSYEGSGQPLETWYTL